MKIILFLFILMMSINVFSIEATGDTTVTRFITYNQYGNGDVAFKVANPTVNCFGYWLTTTDVGFDANVSHLLAAYQTKSKLKIHGYTDQRWSGSRNFWCKLYAVEYAK